jgi:hypothetical protein
MHTHTLILHIREAQVYETLKALALQLGVEVEDAAQVSSERSALSYQAVPDTLGLYDGLALSATVNSTSVHKIPEKVSYTPPSADFTRAEAAFGAWEEDEESLEELLNMLTP